MEWYPRYPSLWRAKTMHLNPFQEGCYLRLIDEYMETRQPLQDNDGALARIIGISIEEWLKDASGIVRAFFTPRKGLLFQDRCDIILRKQDERSRKQSEKSKKGAEARWHKTNGIDATGIAQGMPTNATGQDRTGQDRRKKYPLYSPTSTEPSMPSDASQQLSSPRTLGEILDALPSLGNSDSI